MKEKGLKNLYLFMAIAFILATALKEAAEYFYVYSSIIPFVLIIILSIVWIVFKRNRLSAVFLMTAICFVISSSFSEITFHFWSRVALVIVAIFFGGCTVFGAMEGIVEALSGDSSYPVSYEAKFFKGGILLIILSSLTNLF